jgi:murein DD-endopeptidase MepM/ murein hydrolase activator NlpD
MFIFRNKKTIQVVLMLFAAALFVVPGSVSSLTKEEIEIQKRNKQSELDRLNQQIKEYMGQINTTQKQAASLNNEIRLFDIEIAVTETQIQATSTNIENTTLQIEGTKILIEEKKHQIEKQKEILAELIILLDKYDNASGLQIGLGSDNFSTFMDQVKYAESVQGQVSSLLNQIKIVKAKLEQDQKELEANLQKMKDLEAQLVETQDALGRQKQTKQKFLTEVRGQESNYKKLLTATQNRESQIEKEIYDLEQQLRSGNKPKGAKPSKGVFAWPMDGVLTQGYGNTGFRSLGYNFHNGLDLAAPAGTPIYAAYGGTVNASGRGQEAYGNWVTLKHDINGKGLITLYAHMSSFVVRNGQTVKKGDIIGYEGNSGNTTARLYGPKRGFHLHFTVFDVEGFGISKGKYGSYYVPYGYTYNPLDFL